jgi:hypothetical protein
MNDVLSAFEPKGRPNSSNFRDVLSKPFSNNPMNKQLDSEMDFMLSKPSTVTNLNDRDRVSTAVDRFRSTSPINGQPYVSQKSQNFNNDDDLLALINNHNDLKQTDRSRRTSLEPGSIVHSHFNGGRSMPSDQVIHNNISRMQTKETELSFKNNLMDNSSGLRTGATQQVTRRQETGSRRRDVHPVSSIANDQGRDISRYPTAKFSDRNVSLMNNDLSGIVSHNDLMDDTKDTRQKNGRTLHMRNNEILNQTSHQKIDMDTINPQFVAEHTIPRREDSPAKQARNDGELALVKKQLQDKETENQILKSENASLRNLLTSKDEHSSQFIDSLKKMQDDNVARLIEQSKKETDFLRLTYEGVISQYKNEIATLNKITNSQNDSNSELKNQLFLLQTKIIQNPPHSTFDERKSKAEASEKSLDFQLESKLHLIQQTIDTVMQREKESIQKESAINAWLSKISEDYRHQMALLKSKEDNFNKRVDDFQSRVEDEQKKLRFESLRIDELELELNNKLQVINIQSANQSTEDRTLYETYRQKLKELNSKILEIDTVRIELIKKEELANRAFSEAELLRQAAEVKKIEAHSLEADWHSKIEMLKTQSEAVHMRETRLQHMSSQLEFQKQSMNSIAQSNMTFKVQNKVLVQKLEQEKVNFYNEKHSLQALKETAHKVRQQQLGLFKTESLECQPTAPRVAVLQSHSPKENVPITPLPVGISTINYELYIDDLYSKMKSYHLNS